MKLAIRDALAERVLPITAIAIGFMGAGVVYARATGMAAPTRVGLDFALWWAWLFGCGLALWLGSHSIARPLRDGTCTWLWVREGPGRWAIRQLSAATLVGGLAYAVVLAVGLGFAGVPAGAGLFAVFGILEIAMLVALSGWFGTLFHPLQALALSGALWFVGHAAGLWLALMAEQGLGAPAAVLLALLPDLDLLDVHGAVIRGELPATASVGVTLLWGTAWTGALTAATVHTMNRRDLV